MSKSLTNSELDNLISRFTHDTKVSNSDLVLVTKYLLAHTQNPNTVEPYIKLEKTASNQKLTRNEAVELLSEIIDRSLKGRITEKDYSQIHQEIINQLEK